MTLVPASDLGRDIKSYWQKGRDMLPWVAQRFPEVELVCTDGKTPLHSSTSDPEIEGWAEQKKQCVMQSSHRPVELVLLGQL